MRSKDIVRLFEHSVLIEYGVTGETGSISTLRLDEGVRFANVGDTIQAYFVNDHKPVLVERFASDALAKAGFQNLQTIVRRYVRLRRIRNFLKKSLIWGAAPVIGLIFALSMNMALTRGFVASAQTVPPASSAMPLPASTSAEPSPVPPSDSELAKAMADGVKAGRYSILRAAGKKAPVYVFSDPLCDYCRRLEPELEKLGRDYTIHIFPVSVVGGSQSLSRVNKLMCNKPEIRGGLWKEAIAGQIPIGPGCADGDAAIEANNKIFSAMGFAGTPTIISENGEQVPEFETAAAIANWLDRRATKH